MKLSVLIPAYNLAPYIDACIRSVCEQDVNFEFEVLVCDDASPDETAQIITRIADEFTLVKPILKKKNGGLAANMQTLLENANGEYIAYLDGDDLALPGKLQKQVDYLDAHPDCHMVFHESDMFDSQTDASIKNYSQESYNWCYIPRRSGLEHLVRYGTYMQASSVMFRGHEHLQKTVASECKIILDYPFYILNAGYLGANIDFIPEVLGRYRIHPDSFGAQTSRSSVRREQSLEDMVQACKLASRFGLEQSIIDAGIAQHYYAAALYFLFRGEFTLFSKYIEESVAAGPFFDERHQYAWLHKDNAQQVRNQLEQSA